MGIEDRFNEKAEQVKGTSRQPAKGPQQGPAERIRAREEEAAKPARRPQQEEEARRAYGDEDDF
ncbi:hypothetical protein [Streptomyces sp. NPDC089799]|uniref:hypothetical protein n=1 Tax=Streptomyces sp. NPDC089799 TaxID=3155066 RepID=UPI003427FB78